MDKNKERKYEIFPIGCVRIKNGKTYLHIFKPFVKALKQLEHFDHIRVFWWLNIADKLKSKELLQNRPPYKKAPVTGVFASRSPMRPNPIGLTTARIIDVNQNNLNYVGNVEVLLHHLIFQLIGYSGDYIDYGEIGYPKKKYPQEL